MSMHKCEEVSEAVNDKQQKHKLETESELGSLLLELPIQLLFYILSKLSFDAIFSCKCVCKKFLMLLEDPYLHNLHLTRTRNSSFSLIIQDKFKPSDFSVAQWDHDSCTCLKLTLPTTISEKDTVNCVISCNGFLCIHYGRILYICNPILGEFMELPQDRPSRFQPTTFGFCPKTKQYKVIRFIKSSSCKIHTLGTDNWRTLENIPHPLFRSAIDSSLNGNFHWITKDRTPSYLICSFNIESEQFRYISPPTHFNRDMIYKISYISVGALDGLLAISYVIDRTQFEIWVMKDYGSEESWAKKMSIEIKPEGIFEQNVLNHPMMFLNNGGLLLKSDESSSIALYIPEKREFRNLMCTGIRFFFAIHHLPSLISLKYYAAAKNVDVVQRKRTSIQKGPIATLDRFYYPSFMMH